MIRALFQRGRDVMTEGSRHGGSCPVRRGLQSGLPRVSGDEGYGSGNSM